MMTWCSYCQKYLGEKPPLLDFSMSHGICQACVGMDAFSQPQLAWAEGVRDFLAEVSNKAVHGLPLSFNDVISEQKNLGISDNDLLMGIIQPVLYEVGEYFAQGKLKVAVEHSFTMFCEDLLQKLRGDRRHDVLYNRPGECENLLVCADDNYHSLGVQFATFFLRNSDAGSVAIYPGLPNGEIIDLVRFYKPRRLGVSVSMPDQIMCLNNTARHLKELPAGIRPEKLIAGGFAFRSGSVRIDPVFTIAPFEVKGMLRLFSDKNNDNHCPRSRADHPRSSVASSSESPDSANSS